jgi:hypothetical protein
MALHKSGIISLFILNTLSGIATAQGIGGCVLPADPDQFRSELDAGFIFPQFSRFQFGDVRNVFPVFGGQVLEEVFNERPFAASYYFGARETYKLPWCFFDAPLELSASFDIYNTSHHSDFNENEATPEVYVPYIDGAIRPGLSGGAVVGLFADSNLQLDRKLFAWELDASLRAKYCYNCWALMPGLFFTYQRMQQEDFLDTTLSSDPTQMSLSAHVNSNHYNLGVDFRFSGPLCSNISWLGCLAIGGEFVNGHYEGEQRFAGDVFAIPARQLAAIDSHRNKWGVSIGLETGVRLFCLSKVSLSILGNFRYISALPYVNYPMPVINTLSVTGPAQLDFQYQFTLGGEANLSFVF